MIELYFFLMVSTLRQRASELAIAPLEVWAVPVIVLSILWAITTIQADLIMRQPRTGRITYAQ